MIKVIIEAIAISALMIGGVASAAPEQPDTDNSVTFSVVTKSTTSWNGDLLPRYSEGQPEVTILKVVIPSGASVAAHKHPMINAGVMLKGKLTVTSEQGEVLKLEPGDAIVELVDKWHKGKNDGDEPVELLVFYAGVKDQPLSIKHTH
ncbi:cupin domain-containing protein [Pseudoalteromonas byunsanensis]|uniref:Cupin n=1 Tax=Pseudoalteromonas byunsanensis TaxID=327939 RepID=A0A1S1N4A3_9GAMM|nr:cupin domain-containing protein [Pseudoalteromonas byunsanensis]OHU93461.1 cupin [Pseudoalteromonas byunsanensis]